MNVCRKLRVVAGAMVALLAASGWAIAEDAGQSALDDAMQAKIAAESLNDLAEVVRLCHKAIDLGLDETNTKFAKNLLAGALWQRAQFVCGEIFDRPTPSPRWQRFRELALADLDESLELDPEQPDGQFLYARLQALPQGDLEKASKAVAAAIKLSEEQPALKTKALLLRVTLNKDPAARRADLEEALKLSPNSAEVLRAQGLFFVQQNEIPAAIKSLDAAIAINPDEADCYEARGMAYFLSKQYDEAMQDFDKAIELAPASPLVYTHRARVKALREKYTESISELNNALQLAPDLAVALLLRARVYQQMGLTEKAIADTNSVLRRDPQSSQALQLHAELLAGTGRLDQAIEDLEGLRKGDPDDDELMLQLATFYSADQQSQKAIDLFTQVIKKTPTAAAYRGRGDAYLGVGKQRDAMNDYEAAIKLDPENSGVLNNLAWLLSTSPDDKLRNGRRAIELGTAACKLTDYKQAHILSTLAACYAEVGDFKTAITWSTKAVEAGAEKLKDQLRAELASYQAGKPWREAAPPALGNQEAHAGAESADASKKPIGVSEKPDDNRR